MQTFIKELKRRKVFRVAGVYAVVSWIIMQIGEVTFPALLLPDWALTLVIVLLLIGFPIALLLSWAFDITPDGIRRDQADVAHLEPKEIAPVLPQLGVTRHPVVKNISMAAVGLLAISLIGWKVLPQMGLFELSASPDQNSLAVLNFQNLGDPDDEDRLGQILQELIITDLSESKTFKVFSSQRLYDLQNQLGNPNSLSIDQSDVLEIARLAGASTLLTGNIIKAGNKTILTSRLIEVTRGTIIKSQRVEGDDIYAMVDELTDLVRSDLNLDSEEIIDIDIPVKEKTSGSMTAYQHYLQGMDLYYEQKFVPAIGHFKDAIAIDSNFNAVYYNLAMAQWWAQSLTSEISSQDALESLDFILKGKHYKTTKEKLLAEGARELIGLNFTKAIELYTQLVTILPDEKDGWYGLGESIFHGLQDHDRSLAAFEKVIELDPNYKLAYRHVFDIYASRKLIAEGRMKAIQFISLFPESPWGPWYLGQMNESGEEYEKAADLYVDAIKLDLDFKQAYKKLIYVSLNHIDNSKAMEYATQLIEYAPTRAEPYRLQGLLLAGIGDHAAAIKAYESGMLINPSDKSFIGDIGYTYQLMELYDLAEEKFREVIDWDSNNKEHSRHSSNLENLYIEQGKFRLAESLVRADYLKKPLTSNNENAQRYTGLALLKFMSTEMDQAHALLDSALGFQPDIEPMLNIYLIKSLALAWEDEQAKLDQLIDLVNKIMPGGDKASKSSDIIYNALIFQQHYLKDEYDLALAACEKLTPAKELIEYYLYQKTMIYLKKGDYENALATTDKMQGSQLNHGTRAFLFPRSYYLRGLIYEATGDDSMAKQSYRKLLSIWKDSDPNILVRQEAENRLARLNGQVG